MSYGEFGTFGVEPYKNARGEMSVQISHGLSSVSFGYLTPDLARAMAKKLIEAAEAVESQGDTA